MPDYFADLNAPQMRKDWREDFAVQCRWPLMIALALALSVAGIVALEGWV